MGGFCFVEGGGGNLQDAVVGGATYVCGFGSCCWQQFVWKETSWDTGGEHLLWMGTTQDGGYSVCLSSEMTTETSGFCGNGVAALAESTPSSDRLYSGMVW